MLSSGKHITPEKVEISWGGVAPKDVKPQLDIEAVWKIMEQCWARTPTDRPSALTVRNQMMAVSEGGVVLEMTRGKNGSAKEKDEGKDENVVKKKQGKLRSIFNLVKK